MCVSSSHKLLHYMYIICNQTKAAPMKSAFGRAIFAAVFPEVPGHSAETKSNTLSVDLESFVGGGPNLPGFFSEFFVLFF